MEQQAVVRSAVSTKPYVVLVGMDFSEPALHALRKALAYASERENVEVHVVCVVPQRSPKAQHPMPESSWIVAESAVIEGVFASLRGRVEREVAELTRADARSLRRAPKRVTPHVLVDVPAVGLVELARELAADVILIGASGQGSAAESLGSVAKRTLSAAPCTVILTRALP